MRKINILKPIWATRSVGINKEDLRDSIEVEILYTDSNGNKLFPHRYFMEKEKAHTYPCKSFGNTPPLYIIPISDFDILPEKILTQDQIDENAYLESQGLKPRH